MATEETLTSTSTRDASAVQVGVRPVVRVSSSSPSLEEEIKRQFATKSPSPSAPRQPVTGAEIVHKLGALTARLREVSDMGQSIADALGGAAPVDPAKPKQEGTGSNSLFELYASALDEIDRIVDNIAHDQARARAALG